MQITTKFIGEETLYMHRDVMMLRPRWKRWLHYNLDKPALFPVVRMILYDISS